MYSNSTVETPKESLWKRLTADVAYELRTPLATVQSHPEVMIDGVKEKNVISAVKKHYILFRTIQVEGGEISLMLIY